VARRMSRRLCALDVQATAEQLTEAFITHPFYSVVLASMDGGSKDRLTTSR
jgi:hypothetical protein